MDPFQIQFSTAFLAGIASFFAPCIIPVLPGFFAFLAGASPDRQKPSRFRVFRATLLFALGFTVMFVLFGMGVNFLGKPLAAHRLLFEKFGGILLIISGILLSGKIRLPFSFGQNSLVNTVKNTADGIRNFLLGITFSIAWIPCIGPILGTILYLATGVETAQRGGVLLFVFSLGLAFPFLLFSLLTPELSKMLRRISFLAKFSRIIISLVFIALGILLFFGKLGTYSGLLIQKFGTGLVF